MQNGKTSQCSLLHFPTKILNGCILIVFLTFIALSDAVCRSSLFKLYKDRYLPNHVFKTVSATSQLECSMHCLGQDECESWNLYEKQLSLNCELNNGAVTMVENMLRQRDGAKFGQRLAIITKNREAPHDEHKNISYIFTTLGAEGRDGPTSTSGYQETSLDGQVTLQNGIQEWRVPHTGTYVIESRGAAGANGTCTKSGNDTWQRGGLGAKLSGTFLLTNGTLLKILVGQRGIMGTDFSDRPGGGGGGSFVTYANNTPLVIAGGGGGGGGCNVIFGESDGDAGQLGILGSRCSNTVSNGGMLCSNEDGFSVQTGAGAGLLGNGDGVNIGLATNAQCFVNGGRGGKIHIGSNGGFGGGGYGWSYGGGGGGYTGGGVWANSTNGVAGGGGSVNYGFDKESGYGDTFDHGLVKVVLIA